MGEQKNYSRVWNEKTGTYVYVERHNYQKHKLTHVEVLSALYLYLNATRGIEVDPSEGQLSQDPYPANTFLLETWDTEPRPNPEAEVSDG